ncbi:MAG: YfhO family protein [Candidatus Competibacteraceae bacterium]|nr:YfhO family protein [Candidatus Competibacteraceae bacterium]
MLCAPVVRRFYPGGRVFHPERSVIITKGVPTLPLEKGVRNTGRSIIAELFAPYQPAAGTVQLLFESESCIDLQVDAIRPSYLVVADQYYPGWQAFVDGSPVEIQRANCAFRAVAMPPGKHRVSMKFRSQSISQGLYLSLAGLLLLCGLAWFYSRKTSKFC